MNRRAFLYGVVAVGLSMAVTVLVRTWTDAAFLDGWGAAGVPFLLAATTMGFVAASTLYGLASRRARVAALDTAVALLLAALLAFAPALAAKGRGALLAVAMGLLALASVASLAAWNAVAATVRGRGLRTHLPRAGAAATLGAAVAGFGGTGLVHAVSVDALLWVSLALVAGGQVAAAGLRRRLAERPPPAPPAKRRAGALAGEPRRLVRWLIIAALGEAAVGAIAEFLFKTSLADRYARAEIAGFVAAYYGVANLGVLALQVLAVPRLLATRSLGASFGVQPLVMLLVLGGAVAAPGLWAGAAARAGDQVLKFSMSRGSQEVALSPLPPAEAARWKILLRGGVTQVGAAAVALALAVRPEAAADSPRLVAGVGLALALAWLVAVRRAARAYLAALAATLGVRRLSLDGERATDTDLDREGMRAVVELTGHADAEVARFGEAMLAHVCRHGAELLPHLAHPSPAVRRAIFRRLAARPERAVRPALRSAVAAERDEAALVAGLDALAAAGDAALGGRARELAAGGEAPVAQAARAYLAELGLSDAEATRGAFEAALAIDGARAARLFLRDHGRLRVADVERAVERGLRAETAEARRQAGRAAAALAVQLSDRVLVAVLRGAEPATFAEADAAGLERFAGAAASRPLERARLCLGLRASERPEALALLGDCLLDEDEGVREAATRSLARLGDAPPAKVALAVSRELGRLGVYAAARAPAGARPPLHEAELSRRAGACLERALALAALSGNRATVLAAARRIRSSDEQDRRRGLDLLQEVARGDLRRRLLAEVERLLVPPRAAPPAEAVAAVRALDPWLCRLLGGEVDAHAAELLALRRSPLFDDLPGPVLLELAEAGERLELGAGEVVVREGEAGDAMYVVLEGRLASERDGAEIGELRAGDAFGELALIDGGARTATVVVREPVRLLRVQRPAFHSLLEAHPEMGVGLLASLARWLRGRC